MLLRYYETASEVVKLKYIRKNLLTTALEL